LENGSVKTKMFFYFQYQGQYNKLTSFLVQAPIDSAQLPSLHYSCVSVTIYLQEKLKSLNLHYFYSIFYCQRACKR
jgi:hypothetical protein